MTTIDPTQLGMNHGGLHRKLLQLKGTDCGNYRLHGSSGFVEEGSKGRLPQISDE